MEKGEPPAWVPLGISVMLLPDGQVAVYDVENPYEVRALVISHIDSINVNNCGPLCYLLFTGCFRFPG